MKSMSVWRQHQTRRGCLDADQHALKKNKRVDWRLASGAIGMTVREWHEARAAQHGVTLIFADYATLLHGHFIMPHEPGRYDHKRHVAFIVEELDQDQCAVLVQRALYAAAFLDYVETRTLIGARLNSKKVSLGFASWLVFLGWEICSASGKNPLKEKETWEVCLRYVKTRVKQPEDAQGILEKSWQSSLQAKRRKTHG